jgi:hypothetical protein
MDYVTSGLLIGFAIISFCMGMQMGWALAAEKANKIFRLTVQKLPEPMRQPVARALIDAGKVVNGVSPDREPKP